MTQRGSIASVRVKPTVTSLIAFQRCAPSFIWFSRRGGAENVSLTHRFSLFPRRYIKPDFLVTCGASIFRSRATSYPPRVQWPKEIIEMTIAGTVVVAPKEPEVPLRVPPTDSVGAT